MCGREPRERRQDRPIVSQRIGELIVAALGPQRLDVAAVKGDALCDEQAGAGGALMIRKVGTRDVNRKMRYTRERGETTFRLQLVAAPVPEAIVEIAREFDKQLLVQARLRLRVLDETFVSLHTPLRSLFPGFVGEEDWLALDARERRRMTMDACRRLLFRESQVQPLVIVFEDLHWIDSETQAFLDHLVEGLSTAPILI